MLAGLDIDVDGMTYQMTRARYTRCLVESRCSYAAPIAVTITYRLPFLLNQCQNSKWPAHSPMKIKDLPPILRRLKFGSQLVTETVLARGSIVSSEPPQDGRNYRRQHVWHLVPEDSGGTL
jgi:hypothetical protein